MHNVFVSHRHQDDALVADLKALLVLRGCALRVSTINADTPTNVKNDDHVRAILAARIRWAGKVIVIVSPDTKHHEWVDWEIDYANRLRKRIIGVWAPNVEGCDLPDPLRRHARAVVAWDGVAIVEALEGQDSWISRL